MRFNVRPADRHDLCMMTTIRWIQGSQSVQATKMSQVEVMLEMPAVLSTMKAKLLGVYQVWLRRTSSTNTQHRVDVDCCSSLFT